MRILAVLALVVLAACGRGVPNGAYVVVAGDSVMAWNRDGGAGVAGSLSALLDRPVGDLSMPFARLTGGRPGAFDIAAQANRLSVPWVVLNGGANDLRRTCGCTGCEDILDRLLTGNAGAGQIAEIVAGLRARGARVIWVDYYVSPRFAGTACTAPYEELETRLRRLAASDPGIILIDMEDVIVSANPAHFARDRLHPSAVGSRLIAELVAEALIAADPDRFGP